MKSEKLNERLFTWRDLMIFLCVSFVVLPSKNSNIENIFKADVLIQNDTQKPNDTCL